MADLEIEEVADDDTIETELDSDTERPPPFAFNEDEPLIEQFKLHPIGEEFLKELAVRVHDDFEREFEASEPYRKRFEKDWKLFAGELEAKTFPFKNCANAHVPILIENVTRLSLRAEGELFGNWNNVFGVLPLGPEDQGIADALTVHGNWQIRNQIPGFRRQMSRGLLGFFMVGDIYARSYYDRLAGLNVHEIITPDEFVTPYTYTTTAPDLSDLPWYAFSFTRYRHEIEAERDYWSGVDELFEKVIPSLEDDPERPVADALQETLGKQKDEGKRGTSPYKLIWWEGWLTLPENSDPSTPVDNPQRFCQVILEYKSKTLLKFDVHMEPNWQEQERFRMQQAELDGFRAAQAEHGQMMEQFQMGLQEATAERDQLRGMIDSGLGGQEELVGLGAADETVNAMTEAQGQLPPPPPPPAWLHNPDDPAAAPEPPKKEPIRLFHHTVCIEPLVGGIGLSYGRIQGDFNRAADTLLSQGIDAATLANCKMFVGPGELTFEGEFEVAPGKILKLKNVAPADVKNSLVPLDFGAANPQMFETVDRLVNYGQSSMQAPAVLSGEAGKSGETYRGLAARIEQATKPLSTLTGKYKDFLESILKANALLNSIFLRDEELMMVADHVLNQMRELRVGRDMYRRNYQVEFRADLRFTSTAQKIAEADEIVQMTMTVPILMQNPAIQLMAARKALQARGQYDMVQLLDQTAPMAMQQMQMQQMMGGGQSNGAPNGNGKGPPEEPAEAAPMMQ